MRSVQLATTSIVAYPMAFPWTPPPPFPAPAPGGWKTPIRNAPRTDAMMLAGTVPGVLAQSVEERMFGFVLAEREPGVVEEEVPLGGAMTPRTRTSTRLMDWTS